MAKTDAYNIMSGENKDKLADLQDGLLSSLKKKTLSQQFKNKRYSGNIAAGSITMSRFVNAAVADYGTARKADKGTQLNNKGKVTINLDQKKEIVEEVNEGDINMLGVVGLVESRQENYLNQMAVALDTAFFTEAGTVATEVTPSGKTIEEKVEELIQSVETIKNEYVDGVDRENIVLFLKPSVYGKLRNHIDTVHNATISSEDEEVEMFHGVRVQSNFRQTEDAIAMVDGSVGLPVNVYEYDVEKIPMSNDYAIQLFYDYGVKAIAPDLIKKATLS